ncbi:MAG: hypothetical protein ACPGXI_17780 [Mycobacterium sp.]
MSVVWCSIVDVDERDFAEWDGLDAVVVPPDAGGYAAALEGILLRIPDGWGRGFRHERGWYRLVVDLDARLAELDPDYVVHQVKEKFGTLRFYCSPNGGPDSPAAESFDALVEEAQCASAAICERCGSPGALTKHGDWLKTLCAACDDVGG